MNILSWIKSNGHSILKLVLIAAMTAVVLTQVRNCSKQDEIIAVETMKTEISITEQVDSILKMRLSNFKPEAQKVYIKGDVAYKVPPTYVLPQGDSGVIKDLNVYKDTVVLKNGTINSEILTDGKVYGTKYGLFTKDTTITNTITRVERVAQSGLFLTVNNSVGTDFRIKDVGAGLQYVHKNKWLIEVGGNYSLDPLINLPAESRVGVNVKFGVKIK